MKVRNQNLMFSRRTSIQKDESPASNLKRTYSVYPINKMRRINLEDARSKGGSTPDVAELAEALSHIDGSRTNKSSDAEPFIVSNSDHRSDDVAQLSYNGLRSVKLEKKSFSSSTSSPRGTDKGTMDSLKSELSKCKRELNDYNNATKELEQKYMKINVELGELQQTHERFIANRTLGKHDSTDSCRDGPEFSLKRKCTHVFQRDKDKLTPRSGKALIQPANDPKCTGILRNKQKKSTVEFTYCQQQQQQDPPSQSSSVRSRFSSKCNKFFELPTQASSDGMQDEISAKERNLDDIYDAILQAMGSQLNKAKESKMSPRSAAAFGKCNNRFQCGNGDTDPVDLEKIIINLKNEQDRYRSLITEQQNYLEDYEARCERAKQIMESQQIEIQKLTSCNKDLQNEVNKGIDQLRMKVDAKLRQVGPLTERLGEEQSRYQRIARENVILKEHKRTLQEQAKELKNKIEEMNKKRTLMFNRLKNAERDLRVFRTYNAALKQEKAKNAEELKKLKDKLDGMQDVHKRALLRQRDMSDKHCRELQRRVYDLEQRLGRSNNSTSSLLQERDRLISELQTQINTLVHNFEVSQKHIRLLRRHLHDAAGDLSSPKPTAGAIVSATPIITALKRKALTKAPVK